MSTSPVLDGHTHLGLLRFMVKPVSEERRKLPAFQDRLECSVSDLLASMDAHGIAQAVAFPFPAEEVDAVQANYYVLQAQSANPQRILAFALVGDDVEFWLRQGARGFKQHALVQNPQRFDLPRAHRAMAEAGVPLMIHCWTRGGTTVPEQIRSILGYAPQLKVIVAHMGRRMPNTDLDVADNLAGLRDLGNVYVDTSTIRQPQAVRLAVQVLGEDRVIFGSDFPFNSQDPDSVGSELRVVDEAGLNARARRKVLGLNLMACLGLPVPQGQVR